MEWRKPSFWRATWVLTRRWLCRLRREPIGLVAAVVHPVFWLRLFGHLFADTLAGIEHQYTAFITAGVLAMTVFGAAWDGGIDILFDREAGVLQRIMATPTPAGAVIGSRLIFVLGLTFFQCLLLLATAGLLRVEIVSGVPGLVLIMATAVLLGSGILCLSLSLAFTLSGHSQFFSISSVLSLPLLFTSNALVPLEQMPQWLTVVAKVNPLTYAITLMREVMLTGVDWQLVVQTFLVISLLDIGALILALRSMRRASRKGLLEAV